MGKKLFPYIIALSALAVSASAAFYSVSGLMKLFAGASIAVGIMAGSLEVAKLVIASLLYQYWDTLNKILRTYLILAATVLILITSAGIYGFLSSAYQHVADKEQIIHQQITALETKKKLFEDSRNNLLKEKQGLLQFKENISKSATTQYTDRKGNLVVRSNTASYKELDRTSKTDEILSEKLDRMNDSIFNLENKILQVKTNLTSTSELGPLKYIAKLTGYGLERIVNWFLLVIIFVFDPLAIALVVAANFAFTRPEESPIVETVDEEVIIQESEDVSLEEPQEPLQEVLEDIQTPSGTPIQQVTQAQREIQEIQNSPHFSEWKKKQMIQERLKKERADENSKQYWR